MTQLEQIIALGNMGYSKEEITTLLAQTVQQPTVTPAQPVATPIQQQTAPAQPVAAPIQQQTAPAQPAQTVQQTAPAQQPVANNVDFLEALKLIGQNIAQQPAAVPVQQPAPAQVPVQQPAQTPAPVQQPSINLTAEDLVKLTQGIAVQTAAGSIETPKSANDIILGMLDVYESTVKKEE